LVQSWPLTLHIWYDGYYNPDTNICQRWLSLGGKQESKKILEKFSFLLWCHHMTS
jgi:hypothetical protein